MNHKLSSIEDELFSTKVEEASKKELKEEGINMKYK